MATPDNLSPFDSDNPKEEDVPRYPYTVKIQGAVPNQGPDALALLPDQ
jgi:hypothetical protein